MNIIRIKPDTILAAWPNIQWESLIELFVDVWVLLQYSSVNFCELRKLRNVPGVNPDEPVWEAFQKTKDPYEAVQLFL